jgi:toxin YoeB
MSGALNIMWTAEAWDNYIDWQGQGKKTLKRINQLIKDIQRAPFEGFF